MTGILKMFSRGVFCWKDPSEMSGFQHFVLFFGGFFFVSFFFYIINVISLLLNDCIV